MIGKIIIYVILIGVFCIGGHLYDLGYYIGSPAGFTNGFLYLNEVELEHLGWYMQYGSFFVLVVLLGNEYFYYRLKNGQTEN